MEAIIERKHQASDMGTRLSSLSKEDFEKIFIEGVDRYISGRISKVERSIFEAYEEEKMNEGLRSTIRELDFSTLKQIDAVMRRDRIHTTTSTIRPNGLSNLAISLYVALVKGVYSRTLEKCSSEYSLYDLSEIGQSKKEFEQALTSCSYDKDKKFYAAEKAMDALTGINKTVTDRLSLELSNNKSKVPENQKGLRYYGHTQSVIRK